MKFPGNIHRYLPIGSCTNIVPLFFEIVFEQFEDGLLIIDYQNFLRGFITHTGFFYKGREKLNYGKGSVKDLTIS